MSDPDVTVAVCTLDRPRALHTSLESLAAMERPDELAWEVLVVDNGQDPGTGEAVAELRGRLSLRLVRESRLGLSRARNRSVDEAGGDWIVWIDDDVRVGNSWLVAYARAFREWPEATFFGGPIRPSFEGRPPAWLRDAYEGIGAVRDAYGSRDLGPRPRPIRQREDLPYGGNFAVRRDVLSPGAFDPRLGRQGRELLGGEELELLSRLLDRGHHGRWVPDAELEHLIPPERQTVAHLRAYFRGQGRVQEPLPEDRPVETLLGKPRWAWRARVQEELKYRLLRPFVPADRWMPHLIAASFAAGALQGPRDGGAGA